MGQLWGVGSADMVRPSSPVRSSYVTLSLHTTSVIFELRNVSHAASAGARHDG